MGLNKQVFVDKFDTFLAAFEKDCPFKRPEQLQEHRSTIARRLELGSATSSITDRDFVEGLYRTLKAWGIGSRRSRLLSLTSFADALRAAEDRIRPLEGRTLEEASLDPKTTAALWELSSTLGIVENEAKLVAGTKALHHILPELVVPMDREYTQLLFGWQNPRFQYAQRECFLEAYGIFGEVARTIDLSRYVGKTSWSTSRTKVVDNAVVGAICFLKASAG